MNAQDYKSICSRPDAFGRGVIEASEQELRSRHPPSASRLREVLSSCPVSKPLLHDGDDYSDYFIVTLNEAEAEQIVEYLVDAEAAAVRADGDTTPQASHLASLIDAWVRYVDFCGEACESAPTGYDL